MMEPQALQPNTRIGYNYCHAPGYNNNAKNTYNLSFFRFPKDLRRCNIWIKNSKLGNRAGNTPEYCYQHYWLCSEHFEEHMFANVLKNRLKKIAIPTLFNPAIGDVSSPTTNFEQQLDCEEDYAVVDPIINTAGGTTPEDAVENVSTEIEPDLYEEEYLPDVPDVELIGSPPPTSTPSPADTQTPKSFAEGTPQKLMYQNKIRNLQKRVIYLGKRVETLQ